jgi:hypothetical protein
MVCRTDKILRSWEVTNWPAVDLYLMHCEIPYRRPLPTSFRMLTLQVPHAYKADENNKTVRHPSGNGKVQPILQKHAGISV